jgi:nucleoside phosphorylase
MNQPAKYAIVSALEREISGLVKGWERCGIDGLKSKCWRQGEFIAAVLGMGWDNAFEGTKVVIEAFRPELVTSIGYSGSLKSELTVGSVFVPAQVIGFKTGVTHQTGFGRGTLVSVAGVAGLREKQAIATQCAAWAVDMEAAAVAEVAQACGVRFAAIKSISDGVDDEMDFVGEFLRPNGFKTGAFLAHVALRPKLWGALAKLAGNTQRAAESLTEALKEFVAGPEQFLAGNSYQPLVESPSAAQSARK